MTARRGAEVISGERGFTLLEVIVALIILSISMATFLRVFSTGLRAVDVAEHQAIAAMHAESILAEVGVSVPLIEGLRQGDLPRGYWWRTEVRPYAEAGLSDLTAGTVTAYIVDVTVGWEGRREGEFSLQTIRLARVPQ